MATITHNSVGLLNPFSQMFKVFNWKEKFNQFQIGILYNVVDTAIKVITDLEDILHLYSMDDLLDIKNDITSSVSVFNSIIVDLEESDSIEIFQKVKSFVEVIEHFNLSLDNEIETLSFSASALESWGEISDEESSFWLSQDEI